MFKLFISNINIAVYINSVNTYVTRLLIYPVTLQTNDSIIPLLANMVNLAPTNKLLKKKIKIQAKESFCIRNLW